MVVLILFFNELYEVAFEISHLPHFSPLFWADENMIINTNRIRVIGIINFSLDLPKSFLEAVHVGCKSEDYVYTLIVYTIYLLECGQPYNILK